MKSTAFPFKLTAIRVRQLQLFDLAASLGSISEAARRLNISQPAATEMLKSLERVFSVQLLIGSSKGVVLTPQGERVAARTAAVLRELQLAIAEVGSPPANGELLRVGVAPTAIYDSLTEAINRFVADYPRVQLSLRVLNVADSVAAFHDGEVDIVITASNPSFVADAGDEPIVVQPLAEESYQAFVSAALSLPPDWRASPGELQKLPWMFPVKHSFLRSMLDDWFLARGLTPPDAPIEITPLTAAIEFLRTMPYAVLLPSALSRRRHFSHLRPIGQDVLSLPIRLVVVCKEAQLERAAAAAFIQRVLDACAAD